jgi:hypothetical protein
MGGNRIYTAGNERTPMRANVKTKHGLDIGNNGWFGGVWELMNESKKTISMYFVINFEHLPKSTPGYKEAKLVWLDVTNCARESEFPAQLGRYVKESTDFIMPSDGDWLFATGHVHDGGEKVEMYINDKLVCNSKQMYANRRGKFYEPNDGTILDGQVMPPGTHISDNGVCRNFASGKKGDRVRVKAYYDDSKHMQMRNPKGYLEGEFLSLTISML